MTATLVMLMVVIVAAGGGCALAWWRGYATGYRHALAYRTAAAEVEAAAIAVVDSVKIRRP